MIEVDVTKVGGARQGKEGQWIVAFEFHHDTDISELKDSLPGSQWRLFITPLDDDGNPAE